MTVELSPADELAIEDELLDFAPENYCANCAHMDLRTTAPYCEYWEETTRIESGLICAEYLPQGYE